MRTLQVIFVCDLRVGWYHLKFRFLNATVTSALRTLKSTTVFRNLWRFTAADGDITGHAVGSQQSQSTTIAPQQYGPTWQHHTLYPMAGPRRAHQLREGPEWISVPSISPTVLLSNRPASHTHRAILLLNTRTWVGLVRAFPGPNF